MEKAVPPSRMHVFTTSGEKLSVSPDFLEHPTGRIDSTRSPLTILYDRKAGLFLGTRVNTISLEKHGKRPERVVFFTQHDPNTPMLEAGIRHFEALSGFNSKSEQVLSKNSVEGGKFAKAYFELPYTRHDGKPNAGITSDKPEDSVPLEDFINGMRNQKGAVAHGDAIRKIIESDAKAQAPVIVAMPNELAASHAAAILHIAGEHIKQRPDVPFKAAMTQYASFNKGDPKTIYIQPQSKTFNNAYIELETGKLVEPPPKPKPVEPAKKGFFGKLFRK